MPPETPSFPSTANHLDVCVVSSDFSSTPSLLPRQELHASPPTLPAREGTATPARGVPGRVARFQSRGQQEQEESARSCLLPEARATGHRPLACPYPQPALAHPWGPGLRGIVFTPGVPTPPSLDILNPPSLFPPSLQRPGRRHEDGRLFWERGLALAGLSCARLLSSL